MADSEPFRLTREEQEFVRKCLNTELWRNEIPVSLTMGLLAKMAMKVGYLRQSKITLFSTVVGTFVLSRAVSYSSCFQKLIQQPGNTISERMNQRKRIIYNQGDERNPNAPQSAELNPSFSQQPNYLDVDIDKPDYPGIDPSMTSPHAEAVPTPQPGQTYAELRRQNREAYQQQFRGARPPQSQPTLGTEVPQNSIPSVPTGPPATSMYDSSFDRTRGESGEGITNSTPFERPSYQRPQSSYDAQSAPRRTRVNKYGDVWEE